MKNKIFAFVGTTAAGKTYYSKYLAEKFGMKYIPSVTTRPPRPGNLNEYKHVTKDDFEKLIKEDCIFEYATFNGHYYGKLHQDIHDNLENSHSVYTITADRVKELKDAFPETVVLCVTIGDPVVKNTIKRLADRGHTKEEIISKVQNTLESDIQEINKLHKQNLVDHVILTIEGDKKITFKELDEIIYKHI